jgi:hypothetical protein
MLAKLWEERECDPQVGIVTPSQIIIGDTLGRQTLAYQAYWAPRDVCFRIRHRADRP